MRQAEVERSNDGMSMRMGSETMPVTHLTPPERSQATLVQERDILVEGLTTLLRRAYQTERQAPQVGGWRRFRDARLSIRRAGQDARPTSVRVSSSSKPLASSPAASVQAEDAGVLTACSAKDPTAPMAAPAALETAPAAAVAASAVSPESMPISALPSTMPPATPAAVVSAVPRKHEPRPCCCIMAGCIAPGGGWIGSGRSV